MSIQRRSKKLAVGIAAAGAAGLVAATLAVTAGTGAAVPITKTIDYSCPFPMIGKQNVKVTIKTDIPSSIPVGQPTGKFNIVSTANAGKTTTEGLNLVGASTIEGIAKMDATVAVPGSTLPVKVPNTIPKTNIPADGNDLVLNNITGSTPSLTFDQAGPGKITLGNMLLTMTPKDSAGAETGLGTFESACVPVAGQDMVLHTFEITGGGGEAEAGGAEAGGAEAGGAEAGGVEAGGEEAGGVEAGGVEAGGEEAGGVEAGGEEAGGDDGGPGPQPIDLAYNLKGISTVKAANGSLPLTGGIAVKFDLASKTHVSDLTLNPTTGNFNIMGFLPVTSKIEFQQTAKTTGTFDGSNLTSHSEMYVYLKTVSAWGFPIGGGADCKTVTPAKIDMKGTGFDPFKGGKLATSDYTLPPLKGCGQLNDWISAFAAGSGNTISMDLTKK